jgi:hypothetical protein
MYLIAMPVLARSISIERCSIDAGPVDAKLSLSGLALA